MKCPVDVLGAVSPSELEQWAQKCMTELLYSNPESPEQLSLPDSTQLDICISTVGLVPLYGCCDSQKVLALFAPADPFTPAALFLLGQWWSVGDILRTADSTRDGLRQVETLGERIVLYVLNRIVYRVREMSSDELPFLCHGAKDFAKILWQNGEAVGFYSVKATGSSCSSFSSRTYPLPVMDSMFVRKSHRGKGLGLHMLEDYVDSFKDDYLGLKYPLTTAMYKVCQSYLRAYPGDAELLWEVDSCRINQRTSIASKLQSMSLRDVSRTLTYTEHSAVSGAVHLTEETMEEVTVVKTTKGTGSRHRTAGHRTTEEQSESDIRITEEVTLLRSMQSSEVVQTEELLEMTAENGTDIVITELEEDAVFDEVTTIQRSEEGSVTLGTAPEEVPQNLNTLCSTAIIVENVASEVEECSHLEDHPTGEDSSHKTAPPQTAVTMERVLRTRTVVNIPQPSTAGDAEADSEITHETKDEEPAVEEILLHRKPLRGRDNSTTTPKPTRASARLKKGQDSTVDEEDTTEEQEQANIKVSLQETLSAVPTTRNTRSRPQKAEETTETVEMESMIKGRMSGRKQTSRGREPTQDLATSSAEDDTTEEEQHASDHITVEDDETLLPTEIAEDEVDKDELMDDSKDRVTTETKDFVPEEDIKDQEPLLPEDTLAKEDEEVQGDASSITMDYTAVVESASITAAEEQREEATSAADVESIPLSTTEAKDTEQTESPLEMDMESLSESVKEQSVTQAEPLKEPQPESFPEEAEEVVPVVETRSLRSGSKTVAATPKRTQSKVCVEAEIASEPTDNVDSQVETKTPAEAPQLTKDQAKDPEDAPEATVATEEASFVAKSNQEESCTTTQDDVVETRVLRSGAKTATVVLTPRTTRSSKHLVKEEVVKTLTIKRDRKSTGRKLVSRSQGQLQELATSSAQEVQQQTSDLTTTEHNEDSKNLELTVSKVAVAEEESKDQEPPLSEKDTLEKEDEDVQAEREITMEETAVEPESCPEEAELAGNENVQSQTKDLEEVPETAVAIEEASSVAITNKEGSPLFTQEQVVETRVLRSGAKTAIVVSTPRTTRSSKRLVEEEVVETATIKERRKSSERKRVSRSKGQPREERTSSAEEDAMEDWQQTSDLTTTENNETSLETETDEQMISKNKPLKMSENIILTDTKEVVAEEDQEPAVLEKDTLDKEDEAVQDETDITETAIAESATAEAPDEKREEEATAVESVPLSTTEAEDTEETQSPMEMDKESQSDSVIEQSKTEAEADKELEPESLSEEAKVAGNKDVPSQIKDSEDALEAAVSTEDASAAITNQEENLSNTQDEEASADVEIQEPAPAEEDTLHNENEEVQGEKDITTEETFVERNATAEDTNEKREEAASAPDVESVPLRTIEAENIEHTESPMEMDKKAQPESVMEQSVAEAEADKEPKPESPPEETEVAGNKNVQSQTKDSKDATEVAIATEEVSVEESLSSTQDDMVEPRVLRSVARTASVVSTPRTTRRSKRLAGEGVVETATIKQGRKSTGRKRVSRSKQQAQDQRTSSAEEDTTEEADDSVLTEPKELKEPALAEEDHLDKEGEEVQHERDTTTEETAVVESATAEAAEEKTEEEASTANVESAPLITAEAEDTEQAESPMEIAKESQPESALEQSVDEPEPDKQIEPESSPEEAEDIGNNDVQSQTKDSEDAIEVAVSTEEASVAITYQEESIMSNQDEVVVEMRTLRSGARATSGVSTPRTTRRSKRLTEEEVVETATIKKGENATGRKRVSKSKQKPQDQRTSSAEEDATEEADDSVLTEPKEASYEEIKEPALAEEEHLDKEDEEVQYERDITIEQTAVVESATAEAAEEKTEEEASTANVESVPLSTTEDTEQAENPMEMDKESQPESALEQSEAEPDKQIEAESTPDEAEEVGNNDVQSQTKDSEDALEVAVPTEEASAAVTNQEESLLSTQDEVVETRTLRSGARATIVVSTPRTTRRSKHLAEEEVVETATIKQGRKSTGTKQVSRSKQQPQDQRTSSAEEDATEEVQQQTSDLTTTEDKMTSLPLETDGELVTKDEPAKDSHLTEPKEAAAEEDSKKTELAEEDTLDKEDKEMQGERIITTNETAFVESATAEAEVENREESASTASVESIPLSTAEAEDTEQTESHVEMDKESQPESVVEQSVPEAEADKEPEPESHPDEANVGGNKDVPSQIKDSEDTLEAAVSTEEASAAITNQEESLSSTQDEVIETRVLRSGARTTSVVLTPRTTRRSKRLVEEEVVEKTATIKRGRKSTGRKQISSSKGQPSFPLEADGETINQVGPAEDAALTETNDSVTDEEIKDPAQADDDTLDNEIKVVQGEKSITMEDTERVPSATAEAAEEKREKAVSAADVESVPLSATQAEDTEQTESPMEMDHESQPEALMEQSVAEAEADKEPESLPDKAQVIGSRDVQSQTKDSEDALEVAVSTQEASVAITNQQESLLSIQDEVVEPKILRSGARTASVVSTPRTTRSSKRLVGEEVVETATIKQGRKSTGRKRVSRSKQQPQDQRTSSAEEDTTEEADDSVLTKPKEAANEEIKEPALTEEHLDKEDEEVQHERDITTEETAVVGSATAEVAGEKTEEEASTANVESVPLSTTEDTEQAESPMEMDKESQPESAIEQSEAEPDKQIEAGSTPEESEEVDNNNVQSQTKDSEDAPEVAVSTEEASVAITNQEESRLSTQDEVVETRTLRSGARTTSVVSTPRTTRSSKRLAEEEVVETETIKKGKKSTGRKRVSKSRQQAQEQRTSSAEEDTTEEADDSVLTEPKKAASEDIKEPALAESATAEAAKEKTEEEALTANVESAPLSTAEAEDTEQAESPMEMDKESQPESVLEQSVAEPEPDKQIERESTPEEAEEIGNNDVQSQTKDSEDAIEVAVSTEEPCEVVEMRNLRSGARATSGVSTPRTRSSKRLAEEEVVETATIKKGKKSTGRKRVSKSKQQPQDQRTSSAEEDTTEEADDSVLTEPKEAANEEIREPALTEEDKMDKEDDEVQHEKDITTEETAVVESATAEVAEEKTEKEASAANVESVPLSTTEDTEQAESPMEMDKESQPESALEQSEAEPDKQIEAESTPDEAEELGNNDVQSQTKDSEDALEVAVPTEEASAAITNQEESLLSTQDKVVETRTLRSGARTVLVVSTPRTTRRSKHLAEEEVVETATIKKGRKSTGTKQVSRSKQQPQDQRTSSAEEDTTEEADDSVLIEPKEAANEDIKEPALAESATAEAAEEKTEEEASTANVESAPLSTAEAEDTEQAESPMEMDKESQPESALEQSVAEPEPDKQIEPESTPEEAEEVGNNDVQSQTKDSEDAIEVAVSTEEPCEVVEMRTLRRGARTTSGVSTPRTTRSSKRLAEEEVVETETIKRGRKSTGTKRVSKSKQQPQDQRTSSEEEDTTEEVQQQTSDLTTTEKNVTSIPLEADEEMVSTDKPAEDSVLTATKEAVAEENSKGPALEEEDTLDKEDEELQGERDITTEEITIVESATGEAAEEKTEEAASTANVESLPLSTTEAEDTEQTECPMEMEKESQPESVMEQSVAETELDKEPKPEFHPEEAEEAAPIVETRSLRSGTKNVAATPRGRHTLGKDINESVTEKSPSDAVVKDVETKTPKEVTHSAQENSAENGQVILPTDHPPHEEKVSNPSDDYKQTEIRHHTFIEGTSLPRLTVVLVDVTKAQLLKSVTEATASDVQDATEEMPNQLENNSMGEDSTEKNVFSAAETNQVESPQDDTENLQEEAAPEESKAKNENSIEVAQVEATKGENPLEVMPESPEEGNIETQAEMEEPHTSHIRRSSRKRPRVDYRDPDDKLDTKLSRRSRKSAPKPESEEEEEEEEASDSLVLSLRLDEDEEQSVSDEEPTIIPGKNLRNRSVPSITISPHSTPQQSTVLTPKESPEQTPRQLKRRSAKASPLRTSKRHRN